MSRVLVIEDFSVDRMIIERILEHMGFEYVSLENGDEALKLLDRENFSLITTGMMNPGKMGLELIRGIRGRCSQTPIVVLTGSDEKELARQAIQAGASTYMQKRQFQDLPPVLRFFLPVDDVPGP